MLDTRLGFLCPRRNQVAPFLRLTLLITSGRRQSTATRPTRGTTLVYHSFWGEMMSCVMFQSKPFLVYVCRRQPATPLPFKSDAACTLK